MSTLDHLDATDQRGPLGNTDLGKDNSERTQHFNSLPPFAILLTLHWCLMLSSEVSVTSFIVQGGIWNSEIFSNFPKEVQLVISSQEWNPRSDWLQSLWPLFPNTSHPKKKIMPVFRYLPVHLSYERKFRWLAETEAMGSCKSQTLAPCGVW